MMGPVYLINLDSSTDRLTTASEQLAKAGIQFERVPAYDGRGKNLVEFSEYLARRTHRAIGRDLVGGEIGCYLSHLAVLERFIASGSENCVVLEDDLVISGTLAEAVENILLELEMRHQDWDVVNIGARSWKYTTRIGKIKAGSATYDLRHAHYFPMTTVGLLWSRHGALRFIDSYDGIDAPIDEVLRRQMTRSDRGFSVSPILVNAHDVVSDISGVQRRAKYNRRWNYGFIKQLRLWRNKSIAIAHLIALRMSRKP